MVVELWTNRAERMGPGPELASARGTLRVVSSKPFGQDRFSSFEDVAAREAAERLHGVTSRPSRSRTPAPCGSTSSSAPRCGMLRVRPGVVEAVEANPASDLLVLEAGP